jgi:hypothetical protein
MPRPSLLVVLGAALLATSACGLPRLTRRPGSDIVSRSRGRTAPVSRPREQCSAQPGTVGVGEKCIVLTTDSSRRAPIDPATTRPVP